MAMNIPLNNAYDGTFLKPTDILDPNKKSKDPAYTLAFSEFIYSQFNRNNSAIKSDMASRFVRNRSYGVGNQDTSIYKNWIYGAQQKKPNIPIVDKDTQGLVNQLRLEDMGLDSINFDDVFSPLPKYIDNVVGIMHDQNHNIVVNAVDENSGTAKEELKFGALVREQLKPFLVRFNSEMGIPNPDNPPVLPQSVEDLELFENIGAFKLPLEIAMEKLCVHTNKLAKLDDETKDNLIYDLFVDGYACVITEQDIASGKFIPKRTDVLDIVLEDSKLTDFSDATWGGYIQWYTIHKLRIDTGWDEEYIKTLVGNSTGQYGNPSVVDYSQENGYYAYDSFRIPVLHSYWKSIDDEYYTTRNTNKGAIQTYEPYTKNGTKPPKERNNRKLTKTSIRRLYHAHWPIGTQKVFDYGIVTNTSYNFGKNDVEFPIQLTRIKGKPKIESMIPIEDQIYLTFIKTQNAIAKAPPPGIAVEWSALQNLKYGKKKIHPLDALRLYTSTGNMLYQLVPKNIPGMNSGRFVGKPVDELRGGLGTAIADGIQGLEFLFNQLTIVSGLDGLSMANISPSRDTGKAVSQIAVAATSNSLKSIYNHYLSLKINSDSVAIWGVMAMLSAYSVKDLDECPYFHALGRSGLTVLMEASSFPPAVYGLDVEASATEFEKQNFLAAAQAALQGGKNGVPAITYSEYSFILRYINSKSSIKYLELWIAKKEQERLMQSQKMAQENSMVQAKKEQETAMLKAQQEKEMITLKTQAEIEVVQAKGEQDRKTLALQIQAGKVYNPSMNQNINNN